MDYNRFKYETAQRAKESRKKATNTSIKEMKYRPKIGTGDFLTKTRQVSRFLEDGHKVKVTIMFRGREVSHPELGMKILEDLAEQVSAVAKVEAAPKLDGRNMTMVLAPDRRAKQVATRKPGQPDGAKPAGTSLATDGEDEVEVTAGPRQDGAQPAVAGPIAAPAAAAPAATAAPAAASVPVQPAAEHRQASAPAPVPPAAGGPPPDLAQAPAPAPPSAPGNQQAVPAADGGRSLRPAVPAPARAPERVSSPATEPATSVAAAPL